MHCTVSLLEWCKQFCSSALPEDRGPEVSFTLGGGTLLPERGGLATLLQHILTGPEVSFTYGRGLFQRGAVLLHCYSTYSAQPNAKEISELVCF